MARYDGTRLGQRTAHELTPPLPLQAGLNATWAFFKENMPKYTELYDKASASLMDAVISGACRSFATAEKAAEVKGRMMSFGRRRER